MATVTDISRPVFLVGALRSGTTMLRLMLDAHPQVCNFGEFEYAVRYARGSAFPPADEYVAMLRADRVYRAQGFAIDERLSPEDLVRSFLQQAAERSGKPIVGATIHSRFDLVPRLWPDARLIHLVRDPRDVARSCIGMGWVGNVWFGADFWLDSVRRWQALRSTLPPDACHEVSYESLVTAPQQTLADVCRFLEVEYHDRMLAYPEHSTYEAPDGRLANQWQRRLSPRELALVESKCDGLMQQFGYQPTTSAAAPSPLTQAQLRLQNSYARKAFNIRRYGWPLYVKWQLAKRLPGRGSQWVRSVLKAKDSVDQARLR